jgi:hypothetical protein
MSANTWSLKALEGFASYAGEISGLGARDEGDRPRTRPIPPLRDLPREGGLADLPRADEDLDEATRLQDLAYRAGRAAALRFTRYVEQIYSGTEECDAAPRATTIGTWERLKI